MTTQASGFPRTPHLVDLGGGTRDDKVLSVAQRRDMLSGDLVVEEKVDGANVGIALVDGLLTIRNRSAMLGENGAIHPQFHSLFGWVAEHAEALTEALADGSTLFGEWLYARHSLGYSRLPDWFLAFDVRMIDGSFLTVADRDRLCAAVGATPVRRLAVGRFTLDALTMLIGTPSLYRDGPIEGIVLRQERDGRLVRRAKIVDPSFVAGIEGHWTRRAIERNERA
jgi:hypothetical protein